MFKYKDTGLKQTWSSISLSLFFDVVHYRKLIQFGLMENLIHHLQKYPVLNGSEKSVPSGLQPLLQ